MGARALKKLEPKFSPEEVAEFRSIFELYDTQHCGEVEIADLTKLLRKLRIILQEDQMAQFNEMVEEADADCSGALDFPEFLYMMRKMMNLNFANINNVTAPGSPRQRKTMASP